MADEPAATGEVLPPKSRRILILYGSETGNSQDFALDLEKITERLRFRASVHAMEAVGLKTLTEYTFVIFVISTTGQGEMPKNSRLLWKKLLSRRLPATVFNSVRFTTFGLGDSSYRQFNWAARKLHKRLLQLGAKEFYPRGEADERHDDGIDGAFLPWSISLRSHLISEYPLPEGLAPIPQEVQLPPKVILERDSVIAKMVNSFTDEGNKDLDKNGLEHKAARFSHVDTVDPERQQIELRSKRSLNGLPLYARLLDQSASEFEDYPGINIIDRHNLPKDQVEKHRLQDSPIASDAPPEDLLPIPDAWTATIEENNRLTPQDHWQDVRQLTMVVQPKKEGATSLFTNAGDSVVLYPKNFPEDVQALIDLMEWNAVADEPFKHYKEKDDGIAIEHAPVGSHPMEKSTLRQLLTNNYDLTAIPKRSFFDSVRFFSTDPMHKERLQEFSEARFIDEFYDYTTRPRRSILEILQDFTSIKIPYQYVPLVFPLIRGREYSIASAGTLMNTEHNAGDTRVELLVAIVKYKTVLRKIRRGLCSRYIESLRPDTKIHVTINERGAPFTNIESVRNPLLCIAAGTGLAPIRAAFWERFAEEQRGRNVLFFGARNEKADYFFKDEWPLLNVDVFTAFSRDQRQKIYVQDVIRQQYKLVCELIQSQATIMVCGSAGKMPVAVREAIYDAMIQGGLATAADSAKAYLEGNNQYWEEVW